MTKLSKFLKGFSAKNKGFTLIEILVVIGIIAVLATIVIVAINPARQFAQARNTQRTSNIETILNGVGQRMADNKGVFAGLIPGTAQTCPNLTLTTDTPAGTLVVNTAYPLYFDDDTGVVAGNFHAACLTPAYISAYPTDPTTGTAANTGYTLKLDANHRITISAPAALAASELTQTISLTR